jgi:hypothetical protein
MNLRFELLKNNYIADYIVFSVAKSFIIIFIGNSGIFRNVHTIPLKTLYSYFLTMVFVVTCTECMHLSLLYCEHSF